MARPSVPELMLGLLLPLGEMLKRMPPVGAEVYVVRHAEPYDYTSGFSVPKVYGNHARQVWLTTKGIEQAYAGRDFFCEKIGRMGTVVHSPLWRAFQTAAILMDYYFVEPPPFISDKRLDDIRLGPWLDVPRKDWTDHRSLYWRNQLESYGLNAGGPENPYQTQQRVVESFFDNIQQHSAEQPILFVFHGDPICFLFQYLLGHELLHLVDYRVVVDGEKHKVDKCTIWRVRLSSDGEQPAEIRPLFNPSI